MKRKLLGRVGVDSGQLIITDPCYIDSEWQNVPFQHIEAYKHKKTQKIYAYAGFTITPKQIAKFALAKKPELFFNYEQKTSNGKTMNEMIEAKEVKHLSLKENQEFTGTFSYGGICQTNNAEKHQINYKKGHPGVAVTFNSGYGDGYYPIYGVFNKEGRCLKVEIDCGVTKAQRKFFEK